MSCAARSAARWISAAARGQRLLRDAGKGEHLRVSLNDREQIVEIVRHAAGQQSDRLHPGGPPQVFFQAALFGDIDRECTDQQSGGGRHRKAPHEKNPLLAPDGQRKNALGHRHAREDAGVVLVGHRHDFGREDFLRRPAQPVTGPGEILDPVAVGVDIASVAFAQERGDGQIVHEGGEAALAGLGGAAGRFHRLEAPSQHDVEQDGRHQDEGEPLVLADAGQLRGIREKPRCGRIGEDDPCR